MSDTLLDLVGCLDRDRILLAAPEHGTKLTGRALAAGVEAVAEQLADVGVERGDSVAMVLDNGPEFVQVALGAAALGAAAAPLNPAYTREECTFYLEDLAPRALVVKAGEGAAARLALPAGATILDAEYDGECVALLRNQSRVGRGSSFPEAVADDVALLLHTSGTTSRQKQVPLLHRNLLASARTIAEHYELDEADVSFAAMPLFHVHGFVASVLAPLVSGGSVIVPRRLSGSTFWKSMASDRVTWFSGSPTMLTMLLDRKPAEWSAPALRFARSCSAPLTGEVSDRLESELQTPLLQAYGMTEACHQIASNPLPPTRRDYRSVGMATGTEIVTLDTDGGELPTGSPGEVAIRGPGVTPGYINNPEANEQAFVRGWFRTGDRGVIDKNGYLSLIGRIKELIIRGGENISPYEVEDVLQKHTAIVDAACFGVPDKKYGQVVGAAVVLGEPAERDEILDFCRGQLAAFKVPLLLEVVDSLPKTATGKVQRQTLVKRFVDAEP